MQHNILLLATLRADALQSWLRSKARVFRCANEAEMWGHLGSHSYNFVAMICLDLEVNGEKAVGTELVRRVRTDFPNSPYAIIYDRRQHDQKDLHALRACHIESGDLEQLSIQLNLSIQAHCN